MSHAVNATERRRDRVAVAIFAAGALLYFFSFLGMNTMATVPIVSEAGHPVAVRHFTYLWIVSLVGLALATVGGGAMAWSFWRYHRRPKDVI